MDKYGDPSNVAAGFQNLDPQDNVSEQLKQTYQQKEHHLVSLGHSLSLSIPQIFQKK